MNLSWFLEPVKDEEAPQAARKGLRASAVVLLVALFALYGFFLAHTIDLTTADLGRHIKNGEVLLQDRTVLSTNYYSYTHPDFPVLNHHWASGALLYAAYRVGGFPLVHIFFIALSFAAFAVFLLAARRRAVLGIVGFAALLALPLLAERTEIRPEVFSYLFAGLFFLILNAHSNIRSQKVLWLLPATEVLWVNTHVYFLLGPLLVGAFLLAALVQKRAKCMRLFVVWCATLAATLVNPFGWRALADAVGIFRNYGYTLAENQSVWFLERLGMHNPNFLIFKIAIALLILSFIVVLIKNRRAFPLHIFS